jgi:hypothetical protein
MRLCLYLIILIIYRKSSTNSTRLSKPSERTGPTTFGPVLGLGIRANSVTVLVGPVRITNRLFCFVGPDRLTDRPRPDQTRPTTFCPVFGIGFWANSISVLVGLLRCGPGPMHSPKLYIRHYVTFFFNYCVN